MLKQLLIKIGLLNIYYTHGPTRNDTNFAVYPAQFSQLTHSYIIIRLDCEEFSDVLEERPTFTFRVENFTYLTLTKCQMSRGNLYLAVFVFEDIRATEMKYFRC